MALPRTPFADICIEHSYLAVEFQSSLPFHDHEIVVFSDQLPVDVGHGHQCGLHAVPRFGFVLAVSAREHRKAVRFDVPINDRGLQCDEPIVIGLAFERFRPSAWQTVTQSDGWVEAVGVHRDSWPGVAVAPFRINPHEAAVECLGHEIRLPHLELRKHAAEVGAADDVKVLVVCVAADRRSCQFLGVQRGQYSRHDAHVVADAPIPLSVADYAPHLLHSKWRDPVHVVEVHETVGSADPDSDNRSTVGYERFELHGCGTVVIHCLPPVIEEPRHDETSVYVEVGADPMTWLRFQEPGHEIVHSLAFLHHVRIRDAGRAPFSAFAPSIG